jgi:hypothetical protein
MASIFDTPLPQEYLDKLTECGNAIRSLGDDYTFDGFPLAVISVEEIFCQAEEHRLMQYVWPNEGSVVGKRWRFNASKIEEEPPAKPLMIDAQSANAFSRVYHAINETNQAKLRHAILDSRGVCCWAFDKLIWPNVSYGG